jgi:FixJ family two-component response regulator
LTPREAAVFALVVTGMLNKQIGSDLGIGEKTVKVHRARVMEKMQAGSLAELVQLAGEANVIATRS